MRSFFNNKMIFTLAVCFFSSIFIAQTKTANDDPVLLKINERKVTLSEFEYVYTKNNLNPQVIDQKSVEEYLELFINFNLKVYEAMQLGLDTHASFIDELAGYREQLAQPYLTDQEVANHLVEEALERMQHDIRASHILINLEQHASPEDTIAAWNKLMEIRQRAIDGEDFGQLAEMYSDDPSAKGSPATANRPAMRPNYGDLRYFNVLDMVYPFESAAYNLELGEISLPVRTNFGYHLIKLTDRIPATGRARVAHIMINLPADADENAQKQALDKINEIHHKLQDGEDFAELAQRFSDDNASARRGGELPAFTANRMVPEFIKAISYMSQEGEISQPLRTDFGWHIIKFFEKQIPTEEEAIADLRNRISRDSRAHLSKDAVVQRLKKEYDFKEFKDNLEIFFSKVDESIFEGNWDKSILTEHQKPLFQFADMIYNQQDFASYLSRVQSVRTPESIRNYVSTMYRNFYQQKLMDYEDSRLEEKYPEFRQIMREYHDGILLFELTDQKVWSKAMRDTTGLKEFFENNIDDYMWQDRFDAEIFTFNSEKEARDGRRQIRRAHRRNISYDELLANFNQTNQLNVSGEKGIFEIGQVPVLSELSQQAGVSDIMRSGNNYVVVKVNEFMPSQPKKLNEVRGLVIADYQNYLEKKWVKELREKYDYFVNREALDALISE